jgi:aminoglycoside/choline kinase family phosphotransferase
MTTPLEQIELLFKEFSTAAIKTIDKLPQSGGDRIYFRISTETNESYIATFSNNLKENETFLYFTNHFKIAGAPVPTVFAVNNEKNIYIQEDFGSVCLLDKLETNGTTEEVKNLYKKTLKSLAHLQINGDKNLDYKNCITSKEFGKQAIL